MIIILTHRNIDFDALASMVAVQKLHPDAIMVIEGKLGTYVQDFLALAKEQLPYFKLKDLDLAKVDKVFLVDTNDLKRSVTNKEDLRILKNVELEIVDHHPYYNSISQNMTIELLGACTTILVERIIPRELKLSKFEATLMALGIYGDTGSLLFENTTSRDVLAVAFLLEQGAQLGVVSEYLSKPLNLEQMELFQLLLDNGTTEQFQGLPVFISYGQTDEYMDGLAVLSQRLGEIESAVVWFIVVLMESRIYIVARSKGNGLPVNKIMEAFGGGGHERAASAVVKDDDINGVISSVKNEINKIIRNPHLVKDIMSYPVKIVGPNTKMEVVGQTLLRYGHTGVPVVEDKRLVGVISRRDVDKALKHGLNHAPVKGFMTQDVITVNPELSWEEVQKLMVQHDIGRLPVIENGELVGIVSRSDVLRLIYDSIIPTTSELVKERSEAQRSNVLRLIKGLPEDIQILMQIIGEVARNKNNKAYLVGGFVRDLLLEVPTKDLDVVVEGDGLVFAQQLNERLKDTNKLSLHRDFGTARIIINDDIHLDIASSRREDYDFPGALPTVEGSTLKDDLFRRDFTINAMALCLNSSCFGEMVDYYGGLRDLEQKEIRFLHNLSFIDDPTRIIRAIRFVGRYGFKLAKITKDAIVTALETEVLEKISPERFTEELLLIYDEQNYQAMGKLLIEYGVFQSWFEKEYPWNFVEPEDEEGWTLEKRWLLSLKNINEDEIVDILEKLRLNKNLTRITLEYIRVRKDLSSDNSDMVRVYNLLSKVPVEIIDTLYTQQEFVAYIENYRKLHSGMHMESTGKVLIELGIKQGPEVGKILKEIKNQWLTGEIKTIAEEKEFLNKYLETNKEENS